MLRLHRMLNALLLVALLLSLLLPGVGGQISPGWASRVRSGSTVPSSCSTAAGQVFFKTTGTLEQQGLYECINNVFLPAGSNGDPDGTNMLQMSSSASSGFAPGVNGSTVFTVFRGGFLMRYPAKWTIRLNVFGGTLQLNGCRIWRTALNGTTGTAIDTNVTVTFGGNATPTLPLGQSVSDPISLQVDTDHDYWIAIAVNNASTTAGTTARSIFTPVNSTDFSGFKGGNLLANATIPNRDFSTLWFVDRVATFSQ